MAGEEGFVEISPQGLRSYMDERQEADYLLIDVRQPGEYEQSHIPGAALMPIAELESRLFELPSDKDLIFYCKVGSRSQMAAMLAGEAEVTERPVYHLSGGIRAWDGQTLSDFPRLHLFETGGSFEQLLFTAMNMERGAERFYQYVTDQYADYGFSATFARLAQVETAHARIVYDLYKKIASPASPEPFETLYEGLAGDIVEGGESLARMTDKLASVEAEACTRLLEFALRMEYAAYDLYRSAAGRQDTAPETANLFLDLAQAEKNHMRMIAGAFAGCRPAAGEAEG